MEPVVAGGTYTWSPTFFKDGAPYDVSAATVEVSFRNPNGVVLKFPMSIGGSVQGVTCKATYTNLTTLFTAALASKDGAKWTKSYRVTLSGVVLESKERDFPVYESNALAA